LFTVYHMLAPRRKNALPAKREIYVAGLLMTPVYTHAAHGIAIFECEPYGNVLAASNLPL
jgi:hypothetical protein